MDSRKVMHLVKWMVIGCLIGMFIAVLVGLMMPEWARAPLIYAGLVLGAAGGAAHQLMSYGLR